MRLHRCQSIAALCVKQAIHEPAQVVLLHVRLLLQAFCEGGLPPKIDCNGGLCAIHLMPPAFRNEQCIPCLGGDQTKHFVCSNKQQLQGMPAGCQSGATRRAYILVLL